MNARCICVAAWAVVFLASAARGQFVPGHVFVGESAGKLCMNQEIYGHDQIWEFDPETGEATLFVQIPEEMCGFLTGLVFTPDGSRLRASSFAQSWILEFDSQANMTIALDVNDGIACPWGFNNLAYDADGNFYVANQCTRNILRFPPDGGPPTVYADAGDGVGSLNAIAFAADRDLYFATLLDGISQLRRITPDGMPSTFDTFGSRLQVRAVTGDGTGHVYVGVDTFKTLTSAIFRYEAGRPETKDLLVLGPWPGRHSMTMSPDQTWIYLHNAGRVFSINPLEGTFTILGEIGFDAFLGVTAGIAVVPTPPTPVPAVSGWALCVMTLLVLTGGTIAIQRRRRVIA